MASSELVWIAQPRLANASRTACITSALDVPGWKKPTSTLPCAGSGGAGVCAAAQSARQSKSAKAAVLMSKLPQNFRALLVVFVARDGAGIEQLLQGAQPLGGARCRVRRRLARDAPLRQPVGRRGLRLRDGTLDIVADVVQPAGRSFGGLGFVAAPAQAHGGVGQHQPVAV